MVSNLPEEQHDLLVENREKVLGELEFVFASSEKNSCIEEDVEKVKGLERIPV